MQPAPKPVNRPAMGYDKIQGQNQSTAEKQTVSEQAGGEELMWVSLSQVPWSGARGKDESLMPDGFLRERPPSAACLCLHSQQQGLGSLSAGSWLKIWHPGQCIQFPQRRHCMSFTGLWVITATSVLGFMHFHNFFERWGMKMKGITWKLLYPKVSWNLQVDLRERTTRTACLIISPL